MTVARGATNWLETPCVATPPPQLEIAALKRWHSAGSDDARRGVALGLALARQRRWDEAAPLFAAAMGSDERPQACRGLTLCRLKMGQFEQALEACDQGLALKEDWRLREYRGAALEERGLIAEACDEYRIAAQAPGNRDYDSLLRLMILQARAGHSDAILHDCATLSVAGPSRAIQLAFGAVALDQLGRYDEARTIVDLERHVMRLPIEVPPDFVDPPRFNARLAEEILANPRLRETQDNDFNIHYLTAYKGGEASEALREITRSAFEAYLAQLPERGLSDVLPPPPAKARLFGANAVTRRSGRNGQHIHPAGYLSAVYHVSVPDLAQDGPDNRGALELGGCSKIAGLKHPCWGVQQIPAIPGWLTVFPSHIFHDVVPTHSRQRRIAVALDMIPEE